MITCKKPDSKIHAWWHAVNFRVRYTLLRLMG